MITNFEEYTKELTNYELQIVLQKVYRILEDRIGKHEAISNAEMIRMLEYAGVFIHESRIRKIISLIRRNGDLQRLIAGGNGYYIAADDNEFERYMTGLNQRIESQVALRDALRLQ